MSDTRIVRYGNMDGTMPVLAPAHPRHWFDSEVGPLKRFCEEHGISLEFKVTPDPALGHPLGMFWN